MALDLATATDADGDPLTYHWSASSSGCTIANPLALHTTLTCTDDGGVTVTLTASDLLLSGSATATVTIENVAPLVGPITAAAEPVPINSTVSASAVFTDAGVLDTHTAEWNWGDGTTTAATVVAAGGSGSTSGSHTYTAAGVYSIRLTVWDDDGGAGESVYDYVVVYGTEDSFVTGGGWFWSPAGACQLEEACEEFEGPANFGFVAHYKNPGSPPTGNTQFRLRAPEFNFHSNGYESLNVTQGGQLAQFNGTGTINGTAAPNGEHYRFSVWAGDGSPDTFRIRIWWEDASGEQLVYDNGAAQPLGGGSITIHTGKK